MAEKQITCIRECYDKIGNTLCGESVNSSVSYKHMIEWLDGKHKHIESLELCDDCYEEFKGQQHHFFGGEDG